MDERRREIRKTEENQVTLGFIDQKNAEIFTEISTGKTKNLSLNGVNIVCGRVYPVNTPLKIILTIQGNKTQILRFCGKVIWNIVEEKSELKESGLEFMDLSPVQSLILIEHLYGRES